MSQKKYQATNKPARKEETVWSPVVRIVAIVCAVVLVAAVTFAIVAKSGVFQKNTVVMKVGDQEITACEFNYAYYTKLNEFYSQYASYISYVGIDFSKPLDTQPCTFDENLTWYEYFVDQAKAQLEETYLMYNKAVSENLELSEENKAQLDDTLASLKDTAKESGKSVSGFLSANYGRGLNQKLFEEYLSRSLLASQYYTVYMDGLTYTDDEINAKYDADKNAYDKATYYSYTVNVTEPAEGEEPAADAKTAAQIADEIVAASVDQEAFLNAIKAQVGDSFNAENYLHEGIAYDESDDVSKWLFDASRTAGNVAAVPSSESDTVTVVFFLSRARDEYQMATMRHILLNITDETDEDGNVITDEDGNSMNNATEVKAKADALLAKWKENGGTEDAFAALVHDNTEDPGSKETGGLYEDFGKGDMVSGIEDWIWAEGRKAGDCEVVESTYGYHLVYFVGYGEAKWKSSVTTALKNEAYEAFKDSLKTAYPVEYFEEGMKYVG